MDLVLADRDRLLEAASERAEAAEAVVLELRSQADRSETQLEKQAERLRALGAEAVQVRAEREAIRRDLQAAVAEAQRLQDELTASRRELEMVRREREVADHNGGTASEASDLENARVRAAEELSERRADEIALLEQELGAVRRAFLLQARRARGAEARVEELEAEVRSGRAELESGLSAAIGELEAARASVEEAAARRAPHLSVTVEERADDGGSARGTTAWNMNGAESYAAEDLAPAVGLIRSTIEDARERAAEIEARVEEAVAPLTEAKTELSDWQEAFTELATLLTTEAPQPEFQSPPDLVDRAKLDGDWDLPDPPDGVEDTPPSGG
ncbi:MAG TPA: hypothetical protein VLA90_08115 [Actinomycetota bacterium]|nr:hypothetical protein [Actinomycetota bacterium]